MFSNQKYLKYKKKYLNLKKQMGGSPTEELETLYKDKLKTYLLLKLNLENDLSEYRYWTDNKLDIPKLKLKLFNAIESNTKQVEDANKIQLEAKQNLDIARTKATRVEAARLEAIRVEAARVEADRLEAIRVEAARVEAARLEAEKVEADRIKLIKTDIETLVKLEIIETNVKKLNKLKIDINLCSKFNSKNCNNIFTKFNEIINNEVEFIQKSDITKNIVLLTELGSLISSKYNDIKENIKHIITIKGTSKPIWSFQLYYYDQISSQISDMSF
jgi:hypothetical protein